MSHSQFVATTRGLGRRTPPMRLFEKAKRLGNCNPGDRVTVRAIEDEDA